MPEQWSGAKSSNLLQKERREGKRLIYTNMTHAFEMRCPAVFASHIGANNQRGCCKLLCWAFCRTEFRPRCFLLLNHVNPLCTLQEAAWIRACSDFQCKLVFFSVCVCVCSSPPPPPPVASPQVCLHFFKPMPSCSTWRTGWPDRSSRRFSSSECLSLPAWSSSQWSISHTQVCLLPCFHVYLQKVETMSYFLCP